MSPQCNSFVFHSIKEDVEGDKHIIPITSFQSISRPWWWPWLRSIIIIIINLGVSQQQQEQQGRQIQGRCQGQEVIISLILSLLLQHHQLL